MNANNFNDNCLDEEFRLGEQSQRRMTIRFRSQWHHFLQLFQAIAQMSSAILLELIVGRAMDETSIVNG